MDGAKRRSYFDLKDNDSMFAAFSNDTPSCSSGEEIVQCEV